MKPFLGPEREEWATWTCGYAPGPGDVHCGRDVTWHGIALDDDGDGAAGLSSCDEHVPQMKLTADYVHPHQHPCGVPGPLFRESANECYLDWDAAELLAGAVETAGELVSRG